MITLTIPNILGKSNGILKKGFDKTLKNTPTVREDLLKTSWESTKIALII